MATTADIRAALSGDYQQYLGRSGLDEGSGLDYWTGQVQSGALTPEQARQMISGSDEALAYQARQQQMPASDPTTSNVGLAGQEAALNQGYTSALEGLQAGVTQGRTDITSGLTDALETLQPGIQAGQQASGLMAALTGAAGPEAQAQAYANYAESPGQQYLRDQAERSLVRNAAATGGLGGGNVQQALQEQAVGLAAQDYGNQFNRLGTTAQLNNPFVQQGANLQSGTGQALGNMAFGAGQQAGNYGFQTGNLLSQARGQAGRDLASISQGLGQGTANLGQTQGAGISDIFGQGGANLAGLLQGAGQNQAGAQGNLMSLLANIATMQPNLQGIPGATQTPGNIGNLGTLASGVGTFLGAI